MNGAAKWHTHDVGSFAEETSKLMGALSGWWRDQTVASNDGGSAETDDVFTAAENLTAHIANGAAECSSCPICRAIHAVRTLDPEVKAHLNVAMASLAQAASALMDTDTSAKET